MCMYDYVDDEIFNAYARINTTKPFAAAAQPHLAHSSGVWPNLSSVDGLAPLATSSSTCIA